MSAPRRSLHADLDWLMQLTQRLGGRLPATLELGATPEGHVLAQIIGDRQTRPLAARGADAAYAIRRTPRRMRARRQAAPAARLTPASGIDTGPSP
jgi:hypothetical protein